MDKGVVGYGVFKDKIPGGEHLIRDFVENQIIANEVNKERERNEAGRGER